jgi:histidinol phosphatase-like enzyme
MLEASRQIMDFAHADASLSELTIMFGHEWDNRPSEEGSIMIGDRNVDMKAADAFGVRGVRCDPDEGIGGVFDSIEG